MDPCVCAVTTSATREELALNCNHAIPRQLHIRGDRRQLPGQSRPSGDDLSRLIKKTARNNFSTTNIPGTSSSGFRFSKYLFPNLHSNEREVSRRGTLCHVLVCADKSPRFRITNVLHLLPPFTQANTSHVPQRPGQGNHCGLGCKSKVDRICPKS